MRGASRDLAKPFLCLAIVATLLSGVSVGRAPESGSVQQSLSFALFCRENVVVAASDSGIRAVDLSTGRALWSALPDGMADVGPVAAGDSVAVITESWNRIVAVSKSTGARLWQKDYRANLLVSDGRYLYVVRNDDGTIRALDSRSGATVWKVEMPAFRGYLAFIKVRDGFLYTDRFVIDIRKQKIVHHWPTDIEVNAIAFPRPGETLLGDSDGNLTLYDSSFEVTKRFHAGDTTVEAIAASEDGVLVSLAAPDRTQPGVFEFLNWDGKRRWQVPGLSIDYGSFHPFVIAGNDALIVEPGSSEKQWRLTSRSLAAGTVNWVAEGFFYLSWPVVCGDKVFLIDGDNLRAFNISDGRPSGNPARVQSRSASDKFVGPCYKIKGRLSYYNGAPSTRIWIVGTHRMLGIPGEENELPPNVEVLLKDFDDNIFGDFVVCPLSPERPGRMQMVLVKSASHLVNRRLP